MDSDDLCDFDVFVCFMSIALSCFLCPELNESVSTKYLAVLKDPAAAKGNDFSKLVHDHYLNSILQCRSSGKCNGRRMKALVCCNYVPVVSIFFFSEFCYLAFIHSPLFVLCPPVFLAHLMFFSLLLCVLKQLQVRYLDFQPNARPTPGCEDVRDRTAMAAEVPYGHAATKT